MSEVYDQYVDTAGNEHFTDVETGHHVIPTVCGYCHEDRDGYVIPLEKNCHAYFMFPDRIALRFSKERREFKIKYCPICGRKLMDGEA